jgi:glyoxylase-like metal-dependent hydrolase (beta-lactamase superfamily II)
MRLGELEVLPVVDGYARYSIHDSFLMMPAEAWAPHRQFLTSDDELELTLGGYLVRTGDRIALVDAGFGPLTRGNYVGGALLDNLARYGVRPEDVTDVLFTHLHFDHVGWATQQGQIVFPNATYRVHEDDWAHFVGHDPGSTKKLTPLTERMEFWDSSGPLLPGVDTMVAAGHTPGSTIIVLSSGTDRALLLGDAVHCPVELVDTEWAGIGDVDADLAKQVRIALARELEGTDTPVAAAHFPGLQFGRLLTGQGGRNWVVP